MNWLDYKRNRGEMLNPFDEENAHVPAEVMPGYEPPQQEPAMDVAPFPGDAPPPAPAQAPAEQPLLSNDDLKRLLQPKQRQPNPALAEAFQRDKEAQKWDDVRQLLLAAGTRRAPQLRNLGNPELSFAASQQPKEEDELSRAYKVAQLKQLLGGKQRDPLADELTKAQIRHLNAESEPKPVKPPDVPKGEDRELTPEERATVEPVLRGKKLSPHATWREVHALLPPQQFDLTFSEAKRRAADADAEREASKVERLAKEIGANPATIKEGLDSLEAAAAQKDIPGIGPLDAIRPDVLSSDEAIRIRNQAKDMVNTLLFMKSGQGVSNQERENQYRLYGITGGSEQAFRDGIKRLRRDMEAQLKAKAAGFSPETVRRYKEAGGVVDMEKPPTRTYHFPDGTVIHGLNKQQQDRLRAAGKLDGAYFEDDE